MYLCFLIFYLLYNIISIMRNKRSKDYFLLKRLWLGQRKSWWLWVFQNLVRSDFFFFNRVVCFTYISITEFWKYQSSWQVWRFWVFISVTSSPEKIHSVCFSLISTGFWTILMVWSCMFWSQLLFFHTRCLCNFDVVHVVICISEKSP